MADQNDTALLIPGPLQGSVCLLQKVQRGILVFCSLLMAAVFATVVVLRYVFQSDLFAYEEWVLLAAFWLYFIGGAQGSFDDSHIRADILSNWLRQPEHVWRVKQLRLLLELLVTATLTVLAGLMVFEEISRYPNWSTTTVWNIPFMAPRFGIFLGLLLMAFYAGLQLYTIRHRASANKVDSQTME